MIARWRKVNQKSKDYTVLNKIDQYNIENFDILPDAAVIRFPVVCQLFSVNRAVIYRRINGGTFPKPMKLSEQSVGWRVSVIREHLNKAAA